MRRPQKQQQAATMPSKALRLGSGCAGSGRALLGASAGLLGSARFHHSVQHYVGRPLAPRGAILQRHGLAPPRRVHRTGAVSREEAKKADPATRPLCELVALPLHFFHAMCDNDGYFGASGTVAQLGASNPSLLEAVRKQLRLPASALYFNGHRETSTGRWHHGHSEWGLLMTPTSRGFRQSLEAATDMPIKGARAELALQLLELKRARGEAAERQRLKAELKLLNGTGHASWWAKHNSIGFQALYDMPHAQLAAYVGGLFAANGGSYLFINCRDGTCQPRAFIALGRDGPVVLHVVQELLGFGWLASGERGRCHGLPPSCQYTDLYFFGEEALSKFFKLVNGEAVDLACGHVPATASGLPRTVGKLLKFRVLLEYSQRHQKERRIAAGGGGRPPSRFSMQYRKGCWWCDANNWQTMHAELYPGNAVPDWEH